MTIWKTAGVLALALVACTGERGPAGVDGVDGMDGVDGVDGMPGRDGDEGDDGADGDDGSDGEDGANGADGEDGAPLAAGIFVRHVGRHSSGVFDESAAEVVAFDPSTDRVFVVNAAAATVDVLDLSTPSSPTLVDTIELDEAFPGRTLGAANSVSIARGTLAVAIEADPKTDPGVVAFYGTSDLARLGAVSVGALPDMLTFTPDGNRVLVANEGEPNADYSVDPVGSISVIDVSGGFAAPTVTDVGFAAFDDDRDALRDVGVRIFGPGATVSQDLEPEYVATDGTTAWVTLQENNALAVVDLTATPPVVRDILGLGVKDHLLPGNELDPSDRDGAVRIRNWPVWGMYMPDTIATYVAGGAPYLVTANEGDAREYEGFVEARRVGSLTLDPAAFPDAAALQNNAALGRLNVSTATGDLDGDGDIDELHAFGSRSFSIWDGRTGQLVFDSGHDFEVIAARRFGRDFNSNNDENGGEPRSDDKGPEPEAVTVGTIDGVTYAFIGLERLGGIMVYDVSHPESPRFIQYVNPRNFSADLPDELDEAGDLGPESIVFVSASDSPSGAPLLIVGNEVSGTTSIFEIVVP